MSEYIFKPSCTDDFELDERDATNPVDWYGTLHGEIVRCRDCKHYTDDEMEYYHYCGSWCEQVEPDGFCAWGERRADHDSATDELRSLLDERGVEWEDHSGSIEQRTVYMTPNGWCYVSTANDKWLSYVEYYDMTPEQVIDATLGRGTCHAEEQYLDSHSDLSVTVCSECGVPTDDLEDCNYCPNCGRKVVE